MSMLQPPPSYIPSHGAPTLSSAIPPAFAIGTHLGPHGATWDLKIDNIERGSTGKRETMKVEGECLGQILMA